MFVIISYAALRILCCGCNFGVVVCHIIVFLSVWKAVYCIFSLIFSVLNIFVSVFIYITFLRILWWVWFWVCIISSYCSFACMKNCLLSFQLNFPTLKYLHSSFSFTYILSYSLLRVIVVVCHVIVPLRVITVFHLFSLICLKYFLSLFTFTSHSVAFVGGWNFDVVFSRVIVSYSLLYFQRQFHFFFFLKH